MRLSKTLAAILLCSATVSLPLVATASSSQKARAGAQTPAPQTEITKEKIDAIVSAIGRAANNKDAVAFVSYFAPDARIKIKAGDSPTAYLTRVQYVANLKRSFEVALEYQHLLKSLSITVAPDGQSATAQAEVFEMLTLAQGTVAAMSDSVLTFKIVKGKILITSMEGTSVPV